MGYGDTDMLYECPVCPPEYSAMIPVSNPVCYLCIACHSYVDEEGTLWDSKANIKVAFAKIKRLP